MKTWTIELQEDGDELILPLPEELLADVGWKSGDTIEWIDNKDGSWTMKKKTVKMLHIKNCSDGMMWYASRVGENVEFVREDSEYFWSRDKGGHINIVLKQDADIVEA